MQVGRFICLKQNERVVLQALKESVKVNSTLETPRACGIVPDNFVFILLFPIVFYVL